MLPAFPACRLAGVGYNEGMKKFLCAAALAGLLLAQASWAGEKEMQRVLDNWQQQVSEYEAALSLATSDAQREEITPPSAEDFAAALWKTVSGQTGTREELVQATPPLPPAAMSPEELRKWRAANKQAPTLRTFKTYEFEKEWAAPAVVWLINHPDAFASLFGSDTRRRAYFAQALLSSVRRVHFNNPLVADICPRLAESSLSEVYSLVEKIYEQNPSPAAKAKAALALSIMLGNPSLAGTESGRAQAHSKRVFYLKRALNTAPEDTQFGNASLDDVALEQIYLLKNLSVGSIPPQFTAYTTDGSKITFPKVGKPNLIMFWDPSEDVGVSIMSKQKSLASRYPDLVFCPVVPHGDSEELLRILEENGIVSTYMDDDKGTAGTAYRVSQLPFAVLLDSRAHILYIGYPNMQLQTALNTLFGTKAPATPAPAPAPAGQDTAPGLRPMPQF